MKLLILRVHSICVDYGFEVIRKRIENLALGNVYAKINGTSTKKKLMSGINQYLR